MTVGFAKEGVTGCPLSSQRCPSSLGVCVLVPAWQNHTQPDRPTALLPAAQGRGLLGQAGPGQGRRGGPVSAGRGGLGVSTLLRSEGM